MSSEEGKGSRQKKKPAENWVPDDLIRDAKSFANNEGRQVVSYVRNAIRSVIDESNKKADTVKTQPGPTDCVATLSLPVETLELLRTASDASGLPVGELADRCIRVALRDVVAEEDARRQAAREKLQRMQE